MTKDVITCGSRSKVSNVLWTAPDIAVDGSSEQCATPCCSTPSHPVRALSTIPIRQHDLTRRTSAIDAMKICMPFASVAGSSVNVDSVHPSAAQVLDQCVPSCSSIPSAVPRALGRAWSTSSCCLLRPEDRSSSSNYFGELPGTMLLRLMLILALPSLDRSQFKPAQTLASAISTTVAPQIGYHSSSQAAGRIVDFQPRMRAGSCL